MPVPSSQQEREASSHSLFPVLGEEGGRELNLLGEKDIKMTACRASIRTGGIRNTCALANETKKIKKNEGNFEDYKEMFNDSGFPLNFSREEP